MFSRLNIRSCIRLSIVSWQNPLTLQGAAALAYQQNVVPAKYVDKKLRV